MLILIQVEFILTLIKKDSKKLRRFFKMEALIIVAHGSKIKSSNDEIIEISNKIKKNFQEKKTLK